jgi:hypothetical protein
MSDPLKIGDWVVPSLLRDHPEAPKAEILLCLGRPCTSWDGEVYGYLIDPEINGLSIWFNTQLTKVKNRK